MKEKLEKAKKSHHQHVFTSMAVIGGKLFSNHPKNLNHVHKDSKYLVSVRITVGKYIRGRDTTFYDAVKTYDFRSRAHVLNFLHRRMIFGPFEKNYEGNLWRGHRAVISFILRRQRFLHFYRRGGWFYNQYIDKTDKKIILMMMILG